MSCKEAKGRATNANRLTCRPISQYWALDGRIFFYALGRQSTYESGSNERGISVNLITNSLLKDNIFNTGFSSWLDVGHTSMYRSSGIWGVIGSKRPFSDWANLNLMPWDAGMHIHGYAVLRVVLYMSAARRYTRMIKYLYAIDPASSRVLPLGWFVQCRRDDHNGDSC
ncbi:hypothetical protein CONLIGDRAFT_633894 [Coniochaeta ligniaria NRRL 30616]|uniref:Uncharacterized protein n=1 Tax=Coniochaeta ligniaria NRRL 30616 TaxID=1408157 RepID=A0A1J7JCU5_9PEZI|nr:hypothetical protein CONLIGDRAFT_633894 [Coniochaeta ligniaria NRRL 30616]